MAVEFNITEDNNWFVGEDKILDFTIMGQDGVTPLNMAGVPLEWTMRKTDKAPDPAILKKDTATGGISLVGAYNADPAINTQRVRIAFTDTETEALKPLTYRHSLKRMDEGNESILSFGDLVLRQATER